MGDHVQPPAGLASLLDHLAAALPPPTPEETALYARRHQRAHDRGWCTCDQRGDGEEDGQ